MELDGATARLGGRDGLRSLFATLESVEVEDGINLLNVLGDLLQRRTPVSTVREEHEAALARAALRLPILGGQIGSLLKRMRDRSQKDWTEEEW
jgi:hypothetical protein